MRCTFALPVLVLFAASLPPAPAQQQQQQQQAQRPRLVVLCSVDQLASWVFASAEPFFAADGGFRRLQQRGTAFPSCAYQHACTETGPGHATIGTGAPASVHGIVRNTWWSREDGGKVYCAGDAQVAALPELPEGKGLGPGRLLVPTFASTLKAHVPSAKVASIAWKDRSAILMAGGDADVAAWFDENTGNLVTNTVWVDAVPDWLSRFNGERPIDRFFGEVWSRSGPSEAYAGLVDDRAFEWPHANGSRERTLPQPVTGGKDAPEAAYYKQLYATPFGNTVVRLAAEAAVRGMQLGADAAPDLLCVGFSATDLIGHYFGPESVEARDGLLRLDRELAEFFGFLDRTVGDGAWAVFVTSDHGVGPSPEVARANGVDAGRGPLDTWVRSAVEGALRERLGPPANGGKYCAHVGENAVFLDREVLPAPDLEVLRAAAAATARVRGVLAAYATVDLLGPQPPGDVLRTALALSLCEGRAGDVQVVLKPYWVFGGIPASHGTPHPYDREVVAFAMGPGVPASRRLATPITPGFGVVLFAHLLAVPKPTAAVDVVPQELLEIR